MAYSKFNDLELAAGGNKLKISGKNNGKPVEIIGPLQVVSGGALKLHGQPEQLCIDFLG